MMLIKGNYNHYNYKTAGVFVYLVLLCCCLFSCTEKHTKRNIERSFYYWKSVFKLTDFEKQRLDSLQVKTIYLKFFDVDWDDEKKQPIPKAPIRIIDSTYLELHSIKIIPTVFITNECIQKIDADKINLLADKIVSLVKNTLLNTLPGHVINEVQIDCDWSASTKEKYFSLLTKIKRPAIPTLSSTIRLHQIKYVSATGVPPVERGLLMCYNMGNLKDPSTKNSIIETAELKKYTGNLSTYPLPLDVALPLFEWYVLFRNNQYKGLIKTIDIINPAIKKINNDHYFFLKDTTINDIAFKKGDLLRKEKSEYDEVVKAAKLISSKLKNTTLTLALFHLDSVTLKKYSTHELESIYNSLY